MSSLLVSLRVGRKSPVIGSERAMLRTMAAALCCAGGLFVQTAANAAPGDLDPTFGTGGMVTTDLGGGSQANGAAVQSDGKVVVAGVEFGSTGNGSFVVARYAANGSLDPSFGTGGKTTTAISKSSWAYGMALQPDGRIVAAGFSQINGGKQRFALVRYRTDGHLDTTFGSGGKALTTWGAGGEALGVALAPDGKIVAAGWSVATGSEQFALARYKSNGHLDTSFGKAGRVSSVLGKTSAIQAVAVQADGKIVAAGYVTTPTSNGGVFHFAVARYLVNGSPDPSFGTNGVTVSAVTGLDIARAVAIQPDGKIVVAGHRGAPGSSFAVARYDTTGHPDPQFGTGGVAITDFGNGSVAFAVGVTSAGNVIAAGFAYPPGQFRGNFALASFTSTGVLDPSFGTGGKVMTDFGGYATAHAVALQGGVSPTVIVVGFVGPDGNSGKLALARYLDN